MKKIEQLKPLKFAYTSRADHATDIQDLFDLLVIVKEDRDKINEIIEFLVSKGNK